MSVLLLLLLLCVCACALPTFIMAHETPNRKHQWFGYRVLEHHRTNVGDGAFRQGVNDRETLRTIAPGMPRPLKVSAFFALAFGQTALLSALYQLAFGVLLIIGVSSAGRDLSAAQTFLSALGLAATTLWTYIAVQSWRGAIDVLRCNHDAAMAKISDARAAAGALAACGVLASVGVGIVGRTLNTALAGSVALVPLALAALNRVAVQRYRQEFERTRAGFTSVNANVSPAAVRVGVQGDASALETSELPEPVDVGASDVHAEAHRIR